MSFKSHEEMLVGHMVKLIENGDVSGASKVQNVLREHLEHLMHNAQIYRTDPNILAQEAVPVPLGLRPYTPEEKLAMRMGWGRIEGSDWAPGFTHVAIRQVADLMHVWVVTQDGKSVVLEDEAPLFPSDTFVTKLNMLKG